MHHSWKDPYQHSYFWYDKYCLGEETIISANQLIYISARWAVDSLGPFLSLSFTLSCWSLLLNCWSGTFLWTCGISFTAVSAWGVLFQSAYFFVTIDDNNWQNNMHETSHHWHDYDVNFLLSHSNSLHSSLNSFFLLAVFRPGILSSLLTFFCIMSISKSRGIVRPARFREATCSSTVAVTLVLEPVIGGVALLAVTSCQCTLRSFDLDELVDSAGWENNEDETSHHWPNDDVDVPLCGLLLP